MNKSKLYLALVAAMAVQVPSYTFAAETEEDKPLTAKERAEAKKKALRESEENVIVIGGYQASEVNAINMKKFADTISANLSADDIGVLPDQSIAESLQRLTGVTGNQTDGRSESVNVRGLGGGYTLTTLNGRESVSPWGSRSVNLSLFPGEVIRKAQVFKTAMSESIEGGIGGSINMETIRPLTLKEDIKSISVNINGNSNFDNVNIGDTHGK
ncbi:MAG: TonB-dependent receptor plug domain-containing protein, partial [Gammaproteobacteria bacterium]|nr:TonB-dependent receptor plug domain-containing protein [Gammaproteobacteria bacterium]